MVLAACPALGQGPPLHYFQSADLPPGTIGQGQLQRFPHLRGYFQPVQILLPRGVRASLSVDGQFDPPRRGPVLAGMQVGEVYPLKISSIPFSEGLEVYPTIELINRIYPPAGQELHFPIPVQVTREELEIALSGNFVTRVIYLEDPQTALAFRDEADQQRYYEVSTDQDPLRIADRLGRPVAILRMGSRVPDDGASGVVAQTPPVILYEAPSSREPAPVRSAIDRAARRYSRIPVNSAIPASVYRAGYRFQP